MVSGSELEDEMDTSFIQRHHTHKYLKGYLKSEELLVITNVFLEILVLIFDRIGSVKNPEYGLVAWELSGAVMIVCVAELIYRGVVKEKMSLLQCLKSLVPCCSSEKKPYSLCDGVILGFAKLQLALCGISYACLTQGKQNPVSVSFVSLIFISGFVLYRFYNNRFSEGSIAILPVRQQNL